MNTAKQNKISFRPLEYALMPRDFFAREARSWLVSWGGWIMAVLFGIIAYVHILFIWYFIDYYQNPELYIKNPWLLLSRAEGQFAILLFSLEFITALRTKFIERLFGGFDRVYKMHSIIGRVGFLLAMLHFIFLLVSSADFMWFYIWPSETISVLLGQIALALFLIYVLISVWIRIPYNIWLWIHKTVGVVFMISGFHVWLSQPLYAQFDPYRTVLTVIWAMGVIAYVNKLFFYKLYVPVHKAEITKVEAKHDIVDVYLQIKGKDFNSRPGDFVFIGLTKSKEHLSKEKHPFSISGKYENNIIRLSIKDLGDYTHNTSHFQVGDQTEIYGPFGKFDDNLFAKTTDMVWIGGGIGIAPFLYMAQYFPSLPNSGKSGKRKALLYHAVKDEKEEIYTDEIITATNQDEDFNYVIWNSSEKGYLTGEEICKAVGGKEELKKRMVFMCGPTTMMHALSRELIDLGMHPRQIIFEEFSFW